MTYYVGCIKSCSPLAFLHEVVIRYRDGMEETGVERGFRYLVAGRELPESVGSDALSNVP